MLKNGIYKFIGSRLETGILKNFSILSECKSIVITWFTQSFSKKSAINLAGIIF
ncbi:MAG: hypothetical protein QFX12_04330 [Rickettsia africae]